QPGAPEPRTGSGRTPNRVGLNPQRGWGEPSIHSPIEMTIRNDHAPKAEARAAGPWMDGPEGRLAGKPAGLREALIEAGIRGENLERLSKSTDLTPEIVAEE